MDRLCVIFVEGTKKLGNGIKIMYITIQGKL